MYLEFLPLSAEIPVTRDESGLLTPAPALTLLIPSSVSPETGREKDINNDVSERLPTAGYLSGVLNEKSIRV